jgi:hypothetical protein
MNLIRYIRINDVPRETTFLEELIVGLEPAQKNQQGYPVYY